MQYQIPQDIEVEDKVIGPLTIKQFGFALAGVGFSAGLFVLVSKVNLPLVIKIFLSCPPLIIFFALGFMKFNGRTLYLYFFPFVNYLTSPKQRIWKKEEFHPDEKKIISEKKEDSSPATKAPLQEIEGKIEELSQNVDVNNNREPRTIFEVPSTRDKTIDRVINKNEKEIEKNTEPLVSQIATVSPKKRFETEIPKIIIKKEPDDEQE